MRDWTEIEATYIAGNMTQRDLAASLGISYSTLSKVATENKWTEKRKKHRKKVAKKALGRAGARSARKLERLITATEKAIDTALMALEDKDQFRRYIVTEGVGDGVDRTSEMIFEKVDTKALKDLTGVLRDLTGLARDLYGIRTIGETVAEEIARERLELEKRKVEAELATKETGDEDRSIHVVMEGGVEEMSE